jgi:hypothetical protein
VRVLLVALAFTPAWSYVPAPARAELAKAQGGVLYLPARTPSFYRYRDGATATGGFLNVPFRNRVRVHKGLWRWTNQTFTWQVGPIAKAADCRAFANATKTLQMGGNKVLSNGHEAWRCVTDKNGKRHVLLAFDHSGRLPDVALGEAVASGLDVAGR